MKKIVYAIAALALIFTGCAKELDNSTKENFSKVRLHVKVADQLTKVSADNDGRYHWQDGDKITVFNDAGNSFEFSTDKGGSDIYFGTYDPTWTGKLGNYAMYPASDDHKVKGNKVTFTLPTSISWDEDATNMPMLGKISGDVATFKAVGGVLKLVCYNIPSGAAKLWFVSSNSRITGDFDIDDATLSNPVIETEAASDDVLEITFAYSANKVFYIPLPTGDIDGFEVQFLDSSDKELFSKSTDASFTVARNKMIIAPALNCGAFADVVLSNEDITSHFPDEYSTAGTETINGLVWSHFDIAHYSSPGLQFRKNSGYLGLPDFGKDIASVIVEGVYNGSKGAFPTTSKIQFYADLDDYPLVEIDGTGKAGDDYTLIVPAGNSTGYIMATGAMQITSLTVTFSSLSPSAPSITSAEDPIVISVASGDVNSASTSITYSTSLGDGLGVSIASHSDWITPTLTGTGPYTLTVSANKKVTAGDREDGFVTLRASGVSNTITVTQPSAYVPDPELTVIPGNGHFTATWTKHANAAGYVIYLGDPENGGTNISDDAGLSYDSGTNEYTLTKSVANDDYDLYVSVTPIANYVGQDGYSHENFTCSATSYTVTITQPASGGSITVNGSSNTSIAAHAGDIITIAASEPSTGYKWGSWSVSNNVTTLSSTTATTATFTMPADNVSVTATFPAKAWTLVTGSSSSLQSGDQIIIVNDDYTKTAKRNSEGNNMIYAVVESSDSGATLSTIPNDAAIITLGTNSSKWTLSVDTGTYLYAAGGTGKSPKNQLKETSTIDQKSRWTIEFSSNNAIITCEGGATRNTIRYNSSNAIFSCYASDGQNPIRIYRFE